MIFKWVWCDGRGLSLQWFLKICQMTIPNIVLFRNLAPCSGAALANSRSGSQWIALDWLTIVNIFQGGKFSDKSM